MKFVAFGLVMIGLYIMIYKDFIKFKNYYLGRYFNKILGTSLVILNGIALLVNVWSSVEYFDIIFPIIIGIIAYKIKEKDFKYFLINDEYYPSQEEPKKYRETVRGIVLNDKNEVGLIHIEYDDPLFGYRNHYELPGGGIEEGENLECALVREIEEELGYLVDDIHYLTKCGIEYNPFNRIDNSYIYVCHISEKTHTNFQGVEKEFIKGIEFFSINQLMNIYKLDNQQKVGKMIHERDKRLVALYKSCF